MKSHLKFGAIARWLVTSAAICASVALPAVQANADEAKGGKLIVGIDETASEYWSEYLQGVKDIGDSLGKEPVVLTSNYQGDQLLAQLGATGVLDEGFGERAQGAAFPIEIMDKNELPRMRSLLLGDPRHLDA